MAAFSVTDSNNRAEDMEGTPTVADIGAGQGGGQETVTFLQGAASVSRKVTSSSEAGTGVTTGTTIDMTAAGDNRVWLSKTFLSDYLDINSVGWRVTLGSDTSNRYYYIMFDDGTLGDKDIGTVFPRGGWRIEAVDPNVVAWRDGTVGTPDLTVADTFCITAGLVNGGAKSENVFIDAVDLGDGLYGVDGISGNDGVWSDFLDYDQGSATSGRIGHVGSNASGLEIRGKIIRGRDSAGVTTTECIFTDTESRAIVWVGGLVDAGWNELEDDLTNASTAITDDNKTFIGQGRDNLKRFFDTESQVTSGTDIVTSTGHGFETGDYVLYSKEGGAEAIGLTDANNYFVNAVDADTVSFHSTRADAYSDTSRVDLTASTAGNGENHSIQREPDTRPDYTATSTNGSASYNASNFIRFSDFTLTSGVTFTSCGFVSANSMSLGGADIDTCSFDGHTTVEGVSLITGSKTEVAAINDTTFTAGSTGGHAIEITSGTGSMTFVGNTFTGYGNDPDSGKGMPFNPSTDIDDANDEIDYVGHGWTTGDAVIYTNRDPNDGTAGTSVTGLTDEGLYYVRAVTVDAVSLHPTRDAANNNANKIAIAAGNNEIHTLYSADAAIVNNTGNDITVSVSGGGSTPSIRNIGASTTTVSNDVSITVDTNGVIEYECRVYFTGTNNEVDGIETTVGDTFTFSVGSGVGVDIIVIKIGYEYFRRENISFTSSQTFPVVLRVDRNNPA